MRSHSYFAPLAVRFGRHADGDFANSLSNLLLCLRFTTCSLKTTSLHSSIKMEAVGGFKAPINVSPLIRFTRWSLLLAGVSYGFIRHNRLTAKEKVLRAEAKKEAERMAPILKAEKERLSKLEIQDLEKVVGTKFT